VLPCCENLTCRSCLRDQSYPFDRAPIKSGLKEPQRVIRNMLERVEVQCLECHMVMKRGLKGEVFQKHVEEDCPVQCVWGCGVMLTRATIAGHESVCSEGIVGCSAADVGCEFECSRGLMGGHEACCVFIKLAKTIRGLKMEVQYVRESSSIIERSFLFRNFPFLALRKKLSNCGLTWDWVQFL
jgi:hypothetical protein